MKECSAVKSINYRTEKNLAFAYRDAKCVCVCLSESKNVITFDELHEKNEIFRVCSGKKLLCWVSEPAPWAPPPEPDMEKAHFQGPKLVCEFWCYDVMTYHFGNLLTSTTVVLWQIFYFSPKM